MTCVICELRGVVASDQVSTALSKHEDPSDGRFPLGPACAKERVPPHFIDTGTTVLSDVCTLEQLVKPPS